MMHTQKSQRFFKEVSKRAEKKGMRVNGPKTKLLCIGNARDFSQKSYIDIDVDTRITSGEELNILGFHLTLKLEWAFRYKRS